MYGIKGDPGRSLDRYINKLFDKRRTKSKEIGNLNGCDIDYTHENPERKQYLDVGGYTVGAIKIMDP